MTFVELRTSLVAIPAALRRNAMKNRTAAAMPSMDELLSLNADRVPRSGRVMSVRSLASRPRGLVADPGTLMASGTDSVSRVSQRYGDGAWTQRYEHGVPVTDLVPVESDGTTGTLVLFTPDRSSGPVTVPEAGALLRLATAWPHLEVQVDDRRRPPATD
ncbi:hypothetical protein ACIGFK_18595 [Streptomyces sp. NPDC085524]|uniref:hypothetical protein n=1 Tax=Streptomyces sp. NPDC085524 TaxID=3365728 RepID=UPI0037D2AAF0